MIIHVLELCSQLVHAFLLISVWQLVEHLVSGLFDAIDVIVVVVAAKSLCKDHVGLQNCLSLCMDGAECGIFQKAYEVGLGCLLKSYKRLLLESKFVIDSAADVTDKSLKWGTRNEETG